jgi:methyl-accepting chemotaxis protein
VSPISGSWGRLADLSLRKTVLATIVAGVAAAGIISGLLGLVGQQAVFRGTQATLLHNDEAVLKRILNERRDRLSEQADAITQNDDLMHAMAGGKKDDLEEYSGPVFNRLKKQGVTRLRFFGGDGSLLFQADDGAGVEEGGAWTKIALKEKRTASGLENAQGEVGLTVALPCYTQGQFAGVIEVGASMEVVVRAMATILGTQVGLAAVRGGRVEIQTATDKILLGAAAASISNAGQFNQPVWEKSRLMERPVVIDRLPLLSMSGEQLGIVLSVLDVTPLERTMTRTAEFMGIAVLVWVGLTLLGSGLLLSRQLHPIEEITATIEGVARGDFSRTIVIKREDELGRVAAAVNTMIQQMQTVISEVSRVADEIEAASKSLQEVSQNSADSINKSVQGLSTISQNTAHVAQAVQGVSGLSQEAGGIAGKGRELARKVVESNKDAQSSVLATTGIIQELGKRSNQIGQIIDVISKIADQTNLLSLNAAIEAARAGEAGKGFAVVADEVRKLADSSATSTIDITKLIREMQADTLRAVKTGETASQTAMKGSQLSGEAEELFSTINAKVSELAQQMNSVAANTEEVSAATEEATASAEEQSAGIETLAQSAKRLAETAATLKALISRFNL